jgi:hypothetical protein
LGFEQARKSTATAQFGYNAKAFGFWPTQICRALNVAP